MFAIAFNKNMLQLTRDKDEYLKYGKGGEYKLPWLEVWIEDDSILEEDTMVKGEYVFANVLCVCNE